MPPPPPPPPTPQLYNVNLLHSLALSWPLNTNLVTTLQTRYIAHSFFTPTYLSPLHPSAAASSSHPTYRLYRSLRDFSVRELWSNEGFWRGLFRGVVPSIASIGVRGFVLSEGVLTASDSGTMLASGARPALSTLPKEKDVTTERNDGQQDVGIMLQIYLPQIDPQRVPFATLAAYPFDHIRTLMQLAQHNISAVSATAHSSAVSPSSATDYILTPQSSSAVVTLRSLVQQYGVLSLWRGAVPALVGQTALIGSGLSLIDEAVHRMHSDVADDEADEDDDDIFGSSLVKGAERLLKGGERSDRPVVFPLSLFDRLSNAPPLLSSALLFLSSYLLVFYPASVVSTHMRAATFSSAHISGRPLAPPPHPAASHHLHVYAASSPPPTSQTSSALPGVLATIRRIGTEQGVKGFYRGFSLHACKGSLLHTHANWRASMHS